MKIDGKEVVATSKGWVDAKTGDLVRVVYGLSETLHSVPEPAESEAPKKGKKKAD